ncbi:MAG TPA: GNAT family N-acetyltransferase [Candidatus Binatia bacterium]|nr:GNAT family N-acetyltransferase [Candidatus Binatia bacterium]
MGVEITRLTERDLPAADRIFRLAFGTFVGLPDPLSFAGDTDYVRTRWRADPEATFGARRGSELVGSNFAARWGSLATFGPLSVRPDLWGERIAQALLAPTVALFERWGVRHSGLFTFSNSPKHLALYQKLGFWPGFLTAIAAKPVSASTTPTSAQARGTPRPGVAVERASRIEPSARDAALGDARDVTDAVYEGLDVSREIEAVARDRLGDTVLVRDDGGRLQALAVCHVGPGSEAGSDTTYVKFAAVRPGPSAARFFGDLLDACEALALERATSRLVAGVSTERVGAYAALGKRGFRTEILGVSMHRGRDRAYDRPDAYVLDDWR